MEVFLVSLLNGLVYGMLLFMLASGLTLILSMMGVLNFAHASAYMLGAYFAYTISQQIGFWPALVLAPLLCGAIGAAIEMYGLRRVHRNGHIAELLFTFGLALIIEKVVQMTWGLLPGLDSLVGTVVLFALDWRLALVAILVWPWCALIPARLAKGGSQFGLAQAAEGGHQAAGQPAATQPLPACSSV